MIKRYTEILLILVFIVAFTINTYAYAPSQFLSVNVNTNDIPENTAYIDLLIPANDNDANYTNEINNENSKVFSISSNDYVNISKDSEIASLMIDNNYYSFLFHFMNASMSANSDLEEPNVIIVQYDNEDKLVKTLKEYKALKFAYIDENGNIIDVSNEFNLQDNCMKNYNKIILDGTRVDISYTTNYYVVFAISLFTILFFTIIAVIIMKKRRLYNPQIIEQ